MLVKRLWQISNLVLGDSEPECLSRQSRGTFEEPEQKTLGMEK